MRPSPGAVSMPIGRSARAPAIAPAGWPTSTTRATRDGRSSANHRENSPPSAQPTSVTWSMPRPSSTPAMTLTACSRTGAPCQRYGGDKPCPGRSMSRWRCPGRRPASAAIPIPGAEMPLMNNTGSPTPDSRTRTRTGGDAMSTQRSCTSSPFAAAMRPRLPGTSPRPPSSAEPTPAVNSLSPPRIERDPISAAAFFALAELRWTQGCPQRGFDQGPRAKPYARAVRRRQANRCSLHRSTSLDDPCEGDAPAQVRSTAIHLRFPPESRLGHDSRDLTI